MLLIVHPSTYPTEREYIYRVVFAEFLGLEFYSQPAETTEVRIYNPSQGGCVVVPDVLFQIPPENWLKPISLPKVPPKVSLPPLQPQALPLLFFQEPARLEQNITLGFDLLGGVFFLLSRYEEVVKAERDLHQRFPAEASLALQEGFLDIPLADAYVELLWRALERLWPGLERKKSNYQVFVSHDVDWPFLTYQRPWGKVLRQTVGDLTRKEPEVALRRVRARLTNQEQSDPANTFDWIMQQSEARGLTSEFYFITDHTAGSKDGVYSLEDPHIQGLMSRIGARGHRIGLHPSYHSFRSGSQLLKEADCLRAKAEQLKIKQTIWGGRQHYLRWENPTTWQHWEDAGLNYDSTLGFANRAGFRCGTCREYPVFNLLSRKALALRERPLIAMEVTLLNYMKLSHSQFLSQLETLAAQCRHYGGNMTLLWHNDELLSKGAQGLYEKAIAAIV